MLFKVKSSVSKLYSVSTSVGHNLGVSMLSELILIGLLGDVRTVPITPEVSRDLSVAVKRDKVLTIPMKRLIAISKEFAKNSGKM